VLPPHLVKADKRIHTLMQMQQVPSLLDPADTDTRTSESVFSHFLFNFNRYHNDFA
jgi:hypothetical protein